MAASIEKFVNGDYMDAVPGFQFLVIPDGTIVTALESGQSIIGHDGSVTKFGADGLLIQSEAN